MAEDFPRGVDLHTPSTARIYDYLLGGKDNYAADRRVAAELLEIIPQAATAARANHAFLCRAVRHLAAAGETQFVDVGDKLPAAGNVHETAARIAPDARVLFAGEDPVALTHGRALLTHPNTAVVGVDLLSPADVTRDPAARALIDFDRPVVVILDRVLHFIEDDARARAAVDDLRARLVPGSHVVFTHITQEPRPEASDPVRRVFDPTTSHFRGRERDAVRALFTGFTWLDPGLTYTPEWRPDDDADPGDAPELSFTLAGVVRR
ncbi:SAM-dependent methyltransferase [Actinomadura flavalba]|uniref:SAM-dependent methyltransferase n=1 Tax=Actinomadura flavalba TaxID=1120938 RepID=UPI00037AB4FE|nr:SAM-dependent methyltransferase [Actinomadura flavalba]